MDDDLIHSLLARIAALEAEAGANHHRDAGDIATSAAKDATDAIVCAVDRLDKMTTKMLARLEAVEKRVPQNLLSFVSAAIEPMVDEVISLEKRVQPIEQVAETALAARNAATSAVKSAEVGLRAHLRNFLAKG